MYWGEWTNNPPTCGDPCDSCGNWTGGYYGGYGWHPLQGLHNLWGYRFASAGYDASCESCGVCDDGWGGGGHAAGRGIW